jgi:hypothetical protein
MDWHPKNITIGLFEASEATCKVLAKNIDWIIGWIWLKKKKHYCRMKVQISMQWHQHKNLWFIVNFLVWTKNFKVFDLAMHFPKHANMEKCTMTKSLQKLWICFL